MKFVEKINDFMVEGSSQQSGVSQFTIQIAYEGADIRVSLHCLDPSGGFKEVIEQHKPRSIILTSGTLSPLKAWPLELGVQFAQPVSCPHVLAPEQVNTIVLGIGPSGSSIDTKF